MCTSSVAAQFTRAEKSQVFVASHWPVGCAKAYIIDFSCLKPHEWAFPMQHSRVISPFGGRRRHKGVDIKGRPADTIRACFDGTVRFAGTASGYGRVVVVSHPAGFETLYAHNCKHLVECGSYVKAGQPLAIVGRTGRASTEHCHFEIRIQRRPLNPMSFFNAQTGQLISQKVIVRQKGPMRFIPVK